MYLQQIITQYFISNKSEIWSLPLIVHSKGGEDLILLLIINFILYQIWAENSLFCTIMIFHSIFSSFSKSMQT